MSSSKSLLKVILADLEPLSTFGVMFLSPKGVILYGSFTNEEYENLAADIVRKSFPHMKVSDFVQRGLTELNSKLYVFKIANSLTIGIITSETIGTVLVNLNAITKKYHQPLERMFQGDVGLADIQEEEPAPPEPYELQDERAHDLLRKLFEKIKQFGTLEVLFFEGAQFIYGGFADKEYEKVAITTVSYHFRHMKVSDFIRKTLKAEPDTKLYVCKLSEKITTAFLAKDLLGQILVRLKEIIEEFQPQLDELFIG